MNPLLVKGYKAEAAITGKRFVKIGSADGAALQASSATVAILGISCELDTDILKTVDVMHYGIAQLTLGDVVTHGAVLTSDANGKGIPANFVAGTALYVGAVALESGSADDVINVMVMPTVMHNSDIINVATKTLTAAQLKALNATPIEVVAAPGAGKAIVVLGAEAMLDFATTAYDGIATGEDLALKFTDANGTELAKFETTGFLDQGTDQVRVAAPSSPVSGTNLTPVANAAVVAHMLTGEIATGDSPLKLRVRYRIIDTAW